MPVDPFSFDPTPSLPGRVIDKVTRSLLSRLLALDELTALYASLPSGSADTFSKRALLALGIDTSLERGGLEHIPRTGPLIVVANHPRGGLDGLILDALLRQVRSDVGSMANSILARIPELRSTCFFVDPFDTPGATARSVAGLRAAHGWLRDGGALILFPAGEVAHERDAAGTLRERPWSRTLDRLAAASGAAVVPAHIAGENSPWFYLAGRVHPLLRTLLLPRELLRARGERVKVRVGSAVPHCDGNAARADMSASITVRARRAVERLAGAGPTTTEEIQRLPPEALLLASGRFDVFHAVASEIPSTLQEIGRLRALTFQAVGEGTGASVDLDDFDRHYEHLFIWDREQHCVVGAYRIGRTDLIVRERGVHGLYTRTLFRYGTGLIDALTPALELGRSFVRLEYQRDYQPLLLLWRGIGQFVVRHPEYRWLFGPVSISARYSQASRAEMAAFLEGHHRDLANARMVEPLHRTSIASTTLNDGPATVGEVDKRIATLEADGKGMPVLLRQYLKLGARLLAISDDPAFGNVTDALMAVDLTAVSPSLLRRYFGDAGMALYTSQHSSPRLSPAA